MILIDIYIHLIGVLIKKTLLLFHTKPPYCIRIVNLILKFKTTVLYNSKY